MDDLISRQAAIDALAEVARDRFNLQDTFQECLDALNDAESKIKRLPSAHCDNCPYPDEYVKAKEDALRWIPVSEKSPEEGQMCLVCDRGAIGIDTYIGHGNPYNWKWYVRDYDAWMPLPDPYKEEERCGKDH